MSSTPSLLQKIDTLEGLTTDEKAQLKSLLNNPTKYGLIWEDKPEEVERQLLENLPVLVEVKERYIAASKPEPVEKVPTKKGVGEAQLSLGLETEVGDPENQTDSEDLNSEGPAPHHILIEGDNLHALTALSFTHKDKIDVIYIDPPYNTGNKDFKYNDTFVDKEDSYRHSKWLSFMHKRLVLAKQLLKDTGVIFISIDDNEQAQLKLLCDSIFGETNKSGILIWQKSKKGDAKQISTSHEYVVVYSKDKAANIQSGFWRVKKPGVTEVLEKYVSIRSQETSHEIITAKMRAWYKSMKKGDVRLNHKHYNWSDDRGLYFAADFAGPDDGRESRPRYEIYHPKTGLPVKKPSTGWRWEEDKTIKALQENPPRIHFGKDETTIPNRKSYLFEIDSEPFQSVFYKDGRRGTLELESILGSQGISFPKDWETIMSLISLPAKNALILDFFAGSGTTLHATMQLNTQDRGNRQCILVTNNENNLAEEVCYERNKRVIQGYSKAKGEEIIGLKNNHLHYYKTEFVPSSRSQANRRQIVDAATEIICIRESAFTEMSTEFALETGFMRLFQSDAGQYTLVLYYQRYMDEAIAKAVDLIQQLSIENGPIKVYAFAPQGERYEEEFEAVKARISVIPLPEAIYNAYQASLRRINVKRYRNNSYTEGAESTDQTEINFTPTANARK